MWRCHRRLRGRSPFTWAGGDCRAAPRLGLVAGARATSSDYTTCPSFCTCIRTRCVGNTRYVWFMYQMICPVLERLQAVRREAMGRTEQVQGLSTDEVRGGLRAHPSGWLEPGGGGGGSGCLGAHLPALARPLRGGGSRRSLRPPPGPPRRRGARRRTRWRGCWSCSTPATGTSRPSTSTRSWWPITATGQAQLQLVCG